MTTYGREKIERLGVKRETRPRVDNRPREGAQPGELRREHPADLDDNDDDPDHEFNTNLAEALDAINISDELLRQVWQLDQVVLCEAGETREPKVAVADRQRSRGSREARPRQQLTRGTAPDAGRSQCSRR